MSRLGSLPAARANVAFPSGRERCVAWHYPGDNGACIVMASGMGVTKEPGTDRFAARFNAAGFSVLAFDYRHFGESGGEPRQVARVREQLDDCHAAIASARLLPEVDPARVAVWGFSSAGGHVLSVAARDHGLAAAIAQSPLADGAAVSRHGIRHDPVGLLRLTGRALADAAGGLVHRRPLLVPLAGPPGSTALLTAPDALDGPRALDPDNRHPGWQQTLAARSALQIGRYRPGRRAPHIACPLLVVVCDDDRSVLAAPAVRAAERAPRGELLRLPGGHYEPFLGSHERTAAIELEFLRRHLL